MRNELEIKTWSLDLLSAMYVLNTKRTETETIQYVIILALVLKFLLRFNSAQPVKDGLVVISRREPQGIQPSPCLVGAPAETSFFCALCDHRWFLVVTTDCLTHNVVWITCLSFSAPPRRVAKKNPPELQIGRSSILRHISTEGPSLEWRGSVWDEQRQSFVSNTQRQRHRGALCFIETKDQAVWKTKLRCAGESERWKEDCAERLCHGLWHVWLHGRWPVQWLWKWCERGVDTNRDLWRKGCKPKLFALHGSSPHPGSSRTRRNLRWISHTSEVLHLVSPLLQQRRLRLLEKLPQARRHQQPVLRRCQVGQED